MASAFKSASSFLVRERIYSLKYTWYCMNAIRTFNIILISGLIFAAAAFTAFAYVAFSAPNPVLQDLSVEDIGGSDSEMVSAEVDVFNRGGEGEIVVEIKSLDELGRVIDSWSEKRDMGQLERKTIGFNISEPENSDNFVVDAWPDESPEESYAEPLAESDL